MSSNPRLRWLTRMVWYVAFIAILNIGVGYALAVYLGAGRSQLAASGVDSFDDLDYSDTDLDA